LRKVSWRQRLFAVLLAVIQQASATILNALFEEKAEALAQAS